MSRFDAEREAAHLRQQEADARNFAVGTTVYRPNYDRVEAGTVRIVSRCNLSTAGYPVSDPTGAHPYYCAQFGGGEWVSQTFSWRRFATTEEATRALVRSIDSRIERAESDLRALRSLRAKYASPKPPESP